MRANHYLFIAAILYAAVFVWAMQLGHPHSRLGW